MPETTGKKENVFTRKIGPLPMWAWTAIIGGVVVLYAYYEYRKGQNAQSTASANVTPPVIDQFQLTTPPSQEDQDKKRKDKDKDPGHHHNRHHKKDEKESKEQEKDERQREARRDRRDRATSGRRSGV